MQNDSHKIYQRRSHALLNTNQGGAPYSYLYDGKGNVTALLDGVGNVAQTYQYDPFGVRMNAAGSVNQPIQFSTKPYDEKIGLSYYGFRFYAPALGRWLTRDPLGEEGGINLYGFVGNNSINYIDPYGDQAVVPILPPPPPTPPGPLPIPKFPPWLKPNPFIPLGPILCAKWHKDPTWNAPGNPGWKPPTPDFNQDPDGWWDKPSNWDKMSNWEKAKWYIGKTMGAWAGNI